MLFKRLLPLVLVLSTIAACVPEPSYPIISSSPRFEEASYNEVVANDTDLTGFWIMLHKNILRQETMSGINYRTTGFSREIIEITNLGIDGKISFTESLERRIKLLNAKKSDLPILINELRKKVSLSIERNKEFFSASEKHPRI